MFVSLFSLQLFQRRALRSELVHFQVGSASCGLLLGFFLPPWMDIWSGEGLKRRREGQSSQFDVHLDKLLFGTSSVSSNRVGTRIIGLVEVVSRSAVCHPHTTFFGLQCLLVVSREIPLETFHLCLNGARLPPGSRRSQRAHVTGV